MTPTQMPRAWDRVDAALAGVVAFPEVDRLVARVTEAHPLHVAEARQLTDEVPQHRRDAKTRLQQSHALLELAEAAFGTAYGEYAKARAERRQLARRVFWLRARLTWLQLLRPALRGIWRLLTALPRLFWWAGRQAARPFGRRARERFRGGEDDFGSRGRFRG